MLLIESPGETRVDMPTGQEKKPASSNKVVVGIAVAVAVAAIGVAAYTVSKSGEDKEDDSLGIGYSSEAVVMTDQDALNAAVAEDFKKAQEGQVGLNYVNDAYSTDGINFECYIANSTANALDMFLTIFADSEMTDQIFLSKLVPPGSGFESIKLERALEPGDHTVYVAITQVVTDENGAQTVKNQVFHTMEFHVEKE